jgi:hypothetical protein
MRIATRIAVTGHRDLSAEVSELIGAAVRGELARHRDGKKLVGLTCLADGADQIFAHAVLDAGGTIEVFVPATGYRNSLPDGVRAEYDALLGRAASVHRLEHEEPTSQSHMDASIEMLREADRLFAVWDGKPARDFGGTGDVVAHAAQVGTPIVVIWPPGAYRA